MNTRNDKILDKINFKATVGVEIGALANPIVTQSMGSVYYIDHASTEALQKKYAIDESIDKNKIVDVDYVWGEQTLIELTKQKAPFDYLIACHVIEHVPDFIGWLEEIHTILKLEGVLSLAIPNKYQCFDHDRNITQLSDVLESYLNHSRKPTPRQIFDYLSQVVHWDNRISWDGPVTDPTLIKKLYSPITAWDTTKAAFESDEYYDVHCWVFTPLSFFKLLEGLAELGLLRFEPIQFYATAGCEFFVTLKTVECVSPENISNFYSQMVENSTNILFDIDNISKDSLVDEIANLRRQIKSMQNTKVWKIRESWLATKNRLRRHCARIGLRSKDYHSQRLESLEILGPLKVYPDVNASKKSSIDPPIPHPPDQDPTFLALSPDLGQT